MKKKSKKSLGVNAILNGLKSIMSIIFPLITFPYVSKILQVDNIGKYNFSNSFVSYFSLIASLGISTYAIREGVKYKENRTNLSRFVSEIFTINVVSTAVSYLLLFISLAFIDALQPYRRLILIFSMGIFFTTIGIEWVYLIFEQYAYITLRSICFQVISIILMFTFVKNENDYNIYALITVGSTTVTNVVNYIYAKKYCKIQIVRHVDWKRHIKPILVLFASSIAVIIYGNSDITILGLLTSNYYVGLYSVSVKVYSLVKTLFSALLIVSVPRLSKYLSEENYELYNATFSKIFNVMLVILVPAVIGLMLLSKQVILLISDASYVQAVPSLQILSFTLLACLFGWLFSSCALIPHKLENKVLKATMWSAILNIILNIILVPFGQEKAAAFTTLLAEACSMGMCVYYSRKFIRLSIKKKDVFSVGIGCLAIVLVCCGLILLRLNNVVYTGVSIVFSICTYSIILYMLKNSVLFMGLDIVKGKFQSKLHKKF